MFREYLIEMYNLTDSIMAEIDTMLSQRMLSDDVILILGLEYSAKFALDLGVYANDCLLYD